MPTSDWWLPAVLVVGEITLQLLFVCSVLMRGATRSSSNLAWIVVIVVLPVVGMLAYLLFGDVRLGARRRKRHAEIVERVGQHAIRPKSGLQPEIPKEFRPLAMLAESVGGSTARGGNELQLMADTDKVIEALVADVDAAEHHCCLLFYIYLDDIAGQQVAAALSRAAGRGVECRLLVDAVGSRDFLGSGLAAKLRQAGVQVVGALPANLLRAAFARIDLRNHRKLAVVDGRIGYTGSQNIADEAFAPKPAFAPWVDATLRIRGPAVLDLLGLFIEDWYLDTEENLEHLLELEALEIVGGIPVQVIGTGPNRYNEAVRQLLQAAIHCAREELILTTPYFVPDEATRGAITTAARRGVRTHLVLPARNDSPVVGAASRASYEILLRSGAEIHEYTKGLLHAKTMTIDRNLALVSTANLDRRSFELNFEISTVIYDSDFASQLRFLQRSYMADSRPVEPARWFRRAWPRRLIQNAAGMLSPIL